MARPLIARPKNFSKNFHVKIDHFLRRRLKRFSKRRRPLIARPKNFSKNFRRRRPSSSLDVVGSSAFRKAYTVQALIARAFVRKIFTKNFLRLRLRSSSSSRLTSLRTLFGSIPGMGLDSSTYSVENFFEKFSYDADFGRRRRHG